MEDAESIDDTTFKERAANPFKEQAKEGTRSERPVFLRSKNFRETEQLARLKLRLTHENGWNMSVPTMRQAERHVEENHGTESLRYRTLAILHNKWVQISLGVLLLLDVLILFTELALLTIYPPCTIIRRDAISCCPATANDTNDGHQEFLRFLAGSEDDHHNLCEDDLVAMEQYPAACDDHKHSTIHKVEEVLFGFTIAILSIFFVELLITMWALRPKVFLSQFFYLLDLFIVTVSLALELTFHFLEEDDVAAMVGLLILGRVWRFVRIGHGIVEVVADIQHEQYEKLLAHTEELEQLLIDKGIDFEEEKEKEY